MKFGDFFVFLVAGLLELAFLLFPQTEEFQSMSLFVFDFLVAALSNHPADVFLDDDGGPRLHAQLATHQVAAATGLEPDDVAAQVLEPVRQDPGADESLEAEESTAHFQVAFALSLSSPLALDDDGGRPEAEVAPPMDPAADAALDDDQLLGEDAVALLFQEQVLGVLQKHFGLTQLVVRLAQCSRTNSGRRLPAIHLLSKSIKILDEGEKKVEFQNTMVYSVRRRASGNEESVSFDKFTESVTDRVAGPPDADGFHHSRIAQLSAAQFTIESLFCSHFKMLLIYCTHTKKEMCG